MAPDTDRIPPVEPSRAGAPTAIDALLQEGAIEVLGRLPDSSNGAVLVRVTHEGRSALAIHKPIAFERPLWDFPLGHLAWRERAAHLVCRAAGLALIPPTVLREGPWGPGSLQEWIGGAGQELEVLVDVCSAGEVQDGWLTVLSGEDQDGHPVVLAHSAAESVSDLAVLDAVLNNTDRKGGHVVHARGEVWAFDHGITLGVEPKLRTVLWGWSAQPLAPRHLQILTRLEQALAEEGAGSLGEQLGALLDQREVAALRGRIASLRRSARFPSPSSDWPAIPWPAL